MLERKPRINWKFYCLELLILFTGLSGVYFLGYINGVPQNRSLGNCISVLICLAGMFFFYRRESELNALSHDNVSHVLRFFVCIFISMAVAFVCCFLPPVGWPFLPVFILLALFSNISVGIICASGILMIPVLACNASVYDFMTYFISGVISVILFHNIKKDFKIGFPLFLSLFSLMICETANILISINARLHPEMFVIPLSNIIICGIVLLGIFKIFYDIVLYKYRSVYLDINDTENDILKNWRETDKKSYMKNIHISYFCERIGNRLNLDTDALKCAALYFRLYKEHSITESDIGFPPDALLILKEYTHKKQGIKRKESAVLLCTDLVITSMLFLMDKGSEAAIDHEKVVDTVFQKVLLDECIIHCPISLAELNEAKKIFKEEKLYYDFLR